MEQVLSERYAAPPRWRRVVTIVGVVALAVISLGWLAWAAIYQATPKVESNLQGWDVIDAHSIRASIDIEIHDTGANPSCTLQALADDHTIVGQLTFHPTASGSTLVTVRTQRTATTVDSVGCTADGQDEPR